jgi:hypothetical protein
MIESIQRFFAEYDGGSARIEALARTENVRTSQIPLLGGVI